MSDEIEALQRELHLVRQELTRVKEQLRDANAHFKAGDESDTASLLRQEMRTPLNTVLGFTQLLKSSPFGDCEAVEQIFSAASRLAQLIEESPAAKKPDVPEQDASQAQPRSVKPLPDQNRTVLCIEDNLANSRLIERILAQRNNIDVLFATEGGEGLSKAREREPDLILLDLNLPDQHGSEVLRSLQQDERTENVPVVIISADATGTQIERLLSAGARNYLTKPIDVARFLHTVDEILDGPQPGDRQAHN
jgi:CheY-like chemotaxis protein